MNRVKTVFAAFREMNRLEKRLIPTAVTVAFVTAVMPFINIWFTSKIIDLLDGGAGMKSLTLYIGSAVGINAVLFFVNCFLGEMQFVYRSLMYNKELREISSKLFRIEYQRLENSEFKELVHKHSEAQDRVFSSFVQFTWMMRDFISGALTLVISVVIIIPLLKIGFEKTGTSFFERPAFLLTIFGAIAVMAVIILVVAVRMNKAWFKASDEYSRLDRIFYYFLNMFSDYNTGKEIRVYNEQTLIKHTATDKLLTDGERVLKKASMNTARQSSFVAILGALVGFGIYLFIGTKGLYLSGGEQQRIAIARAMLKNAPILILDEATAFADPDNEAKVQAAFAQLAKGKTVLMIAHRLSTVANADCIYVVQDGQIAESGAKDELCAQNGLFARMWQDYQASVQWKVAKEG